MVKWCEIYCPKRAWSTNYSIKANHIHQVNERSHDSSGNSSQITQSKKTLPPKNPPCLFSSDTLAWKHERKVENLFRNFSRFAPSGSGFSRFLSPRGHAPINIAEWKLLLAAGDNKIPSINDDDVSTPPPVKIFKLLLQCLGAAFLIASRYFLYLTSLHHVAYCVPFTLFIALG